jgi:DNA-binding NarL/FixJ family response regulator
VVADDQPLLLGALRSLLELEFNLVATANNGYDLVKKVELLEPDVAVTDLHMPILNGFGVLRQFMGSGIRTRFVMYTANPSRELAREAFRLGVCSYVLKPSPSAELMLAIRSALEGRTYISPRIVSDGVRILPNSDAAAKAKAAS